MADWKAFAKNNVVSRDWRELEATWSAAYIGFEFAAVESIEEAVNTVASDGFEQRSPTSLIELPGGKVAGFHDTISSLLRAAYVIGSVTQSLKSGQPTWASLNAYHSSLILCRALLGLLGICLVRVKDTNCALDLFPEGSDERDVRDFKRQRRDYDSPARLFFRARSSLIEQSGMWALLLRALRVCELPSDVQSEQDMLIELGEGFGRARNDILYRNLAWPYSPDLQWPLSVRDMNDDIFSYGDLSNFFTSQRDANFAFCALMAKFSAALLKKVNGNAFDRLPSFYSLSLGNFDNFKAAVRRNE